MKFLLIIIAVVIDISIECVEGSFNSSGPRVKREEHQKFTYTNPDDEWPINFPTCGGSRQSPINIELQDAKIVNSGRPLLENFNYNTRPLEMTIQNNGHTVQLSGVWPEQNIPTIFGGPLTDHYEFAQLHFHWGPNNYVGSEHTLSNHRFPLEMHMVHWKKSYQNFSEATKHSDGIAVLSYWMSRYPKINRGVVRMKPKFLNILKPGQSTRIIPFRLSLFDLDLLKEGYVTYLGSLTSPPCSEAVIWLQSVKAMPITMTQLKSFRKIQLYNNDKLNYRPIQPLNNRQIFFYL